MIYPAVATVIRSLFNRTGETFVGLDNYLQIFSDGRTFHAIQNNIIWVLIFPAAVTALGVLFAVLLERVPYRLVIRTILFMPMAVSLLASGVIWRIMYEQNPDTGALNAVVASVANAVTHPGHYQGARPSQPDLVQGVGDGYQLSQLLAPGDVAHIGFIGFPVAEIPSGAKDAQEPTAQAGQIAGVVWRDFKPGGGGTVGQVEPGKLGLPDMTVQLVDSGGAVKSQVQTNSTGDFSFAGVGSGNYRVVIPAQNFHPAFGGVQWLGSTLVTPAIILAAIWVWVGFATVTIGAGLATMSRDLLEAARVDGATEWQVFRRVTVPLLAPLMIVTFITLTINVLKIFDLVYAIAPGSVIPDANVIALQMYLLAFTGLGNFGIGSAIAVFLFLLVIPVMAFNIRRFRGER
ncbi:MAG: ABC transporter permease subunit [Chloroflexi bacterium]|nr:MAG: ABC transporter permease subunit [Chloroflexota bacterium]